MFKSALYLYRKKEGGINRPIGYWSRSFNDAQRACDTTHRECYAVVWAELSIMPYVQGTKFTIRKRHDFLEWMLPISDAAGMLTRWWLRLSEFGFDTVHKIGFIDQTADVISKPKSQCEDNTDI